MIDVAIPSYFVYQLAYFCLRKDTSVVFVYGTRRTMNQKGEGK